MKDKVALITGAGSGIGRAAALAFAREGARLVVTDRDDTGGQETAALVKAAGGRAVFAALDVRDAAQHREAVRQAFDAFGGLHLAVNNAGISVVRWPRVDAADWNAILAVNVTGVFLGLQAQIPAIAGCGGGAIVNIASIMGQVAGKGLAAYVASKHAVVGLTRAAALDYAGQDVRLNAVGPGYVDTPMLARKDDAARHKLAQAHPLGRMARAGEIAEMVAWLCSAKASFVTGAYYPVAGGYLAQ